MDRKELISSSAYWLAQFQIDFFRIVKEYQLINDLDKWQLQSDLDITEHKLNQILLKLIDLVGDKSIISEVEELIAPYDEPKEALEQLKELISSS